MPKFEHEHEVPIRQDVSFPAIRLHLHSRLGCYFGRKFADYIKPGCYSRFEANGFKTSYQDAYKPGAHSVVQESDADRLDGILIDWLEGTRKPAELQSELRQILDKTVARYLAAGGRTDYVVGVGLEEGREFEPGYVYEPTEGFCDDLHGLINEMLASPVARERAKEFVGTVRNCFDMTLEGKGRNR